MNRLRRSLISVPGINEKMIAKAEALPADVVMLDLEDSVAPQDKPRARQIAAQALAGAGFSAPSRALRINGLHTPFFHRDLMEVVSSSGRSIDLIIVPKVEDPGQVYAVANILRALETELSLDAKIPLELTVETARGMSNVREIAQAAQRVEALGFGVADYSISTSMPAHTISGHADRADMYPGHRYHFPMARLVMAARGFGLDPVDGPFGDFKDLDGLRRSVSFARQLGFEGKWAIHPGQLERINEGFTPSKEEIRMAREVVDAARDAGERGALAVGGMMVDQATLRLARGVLKKAEVLGISNP